MKKNPLNKPLASQLFIDKRYIEGKKLILEALSEYKSQITSIQPPISDLEVAYKANLETLAHIRGTPLYHSYLGSGMGNGLFVELADGSVKYDLIGGIGVHLFGHSFIESINATIDGAVQNTIMQGNLQQNIQSLKLMELLQKSSKLDHVFLTSSGAMACENALKVIFQKKHPAFRVIAFEGCFMGRTLAMSQITDKSNFREGLPSTLFVDYIPFYNPDDPQASTDAAIKALKKHLVRHPGEYAVLCLELVQGERGFYAGSKEFFSELIFVAKEAGLAIFVDEVQTFARTYELFCFQHFGLQNLVDVVTIGKVAQVAATFWKEAFNPKPGLLSQTFTSSSAAIFGAQFFIEYLLKHDLYGHNGKIAKLFHAFKERLLLLKGVVHGPFGYGSMIAFTPFDGDSKKVNQFVHRLYENGVISFVAGSDPTRVRFLLPAAVMEVQDVDPIMKIVEKTLKECANEV